MDEKHYKLYVPRAIWNAIIEKSEEHLGMKPTELAKMYLIKGIEQRGSLFSGNPPGPKPREDKKNNINIPIPEKEVFYKFYYLDEDYQWCEYSDRELGPDVFFNTLQQLEIKCVRVGHQWNWDNETKPNLLHREDEEVNKDVMYHYADNLRSWVQEFQEALGTQDQRAFDRSIPNSALKPKERESKGLPPKEGKY